MEGIEQDKVLVSARCMIAETNLFNAVDISDSSPNSSKKRVYIRISCNCFDFESIIRRACIYMFESKLWEPLWLFLVFSNLVVLAIYDYHDRGNEEEFNFILSVLNTIFTSLFFLEALIKMIVLGIWDHQKAYFRSGWHYMDLIIVISGMLNSIPMISSLKGMKVFFALRVLKFAYSWKVLKKLLQPLIISLSQLTGVLLFLLFLIIFFAFIGLNSFQGDFYYRCRLTPAPVNGVWEIDHSLKRLCSVNWQGAYSCPANRYCGHPKMYGLSPKDESLKDYPETYYGGVHFDNVLRAFLTSFQIISFDSWADVMFKIQDSTNRIFSVIYFPLLIFIGSFLGLNLIIAVIVNNFQEKRGESETENTNDGLSTKDVSRQGSRQLQQVVPIDTALGIIAEQVENSKSKSENDSCACCKKFFSTITESLTFRCIIILSVMFNLIVISANRNGISDYQKYWIKMLDALFVGVFIIEMILKLLAQGISQYFSSNYNILDFGINILGIAEVILSFTTTNYHVLVTVAIFRSLRGLKLIEKWAALRDIVQFIGNSTGDIFNFAICLAIFILMYAIIGMELFGDEIKLNKNDEMIKMIQMIQIIQLMKIIKIIKNY